MRSIMPRWVCHLVFNANGIVRMSKGAPALRSGERAVRVKLRVPPSALARAFPEATIDVPVEAMLEPTVEVLPADNPVTSTVGMGDI
jgi:hypothetical protein